MANPSYSFDNLNFTTLPGKYQRGGRPATRIEEDIYLESDELDEFIYPLGGRERYELNFLLVSDSDREAHRALHDAAGGRQYTFWISLDGVGVSNSIKVRKVDPDYDPHEGESPTRNPGGGGVENTYTYTLRVHTVIE